MGLDKPVISGGATVAPQKAGGVIAGNGKSSMTFNLDFAPSCFSIAMEGSGNPAANLILGLTWVNGSFVIWLSDANAKPNAKTDTYGSVTVNGNSITVKCTSSSFVFNSGVNYKWIAC